MGSWNAVRTFNEYKQPGLLSCRGRARGTGRIEARKQGHCIQTEERSKPITQNLCFCNYFLLAFFTFSLFFFCFSRVKLFGGHVLCQVGLLVDQPIL